MHLRNVIDFTANLQTVAWKAFLSSLWRGGCCLGISGRLFHFFTWVKMSRNQKWKNRRDPMSKFWVLLHLAAHTWNTIFYYYAVLLIKWKQILGLGHQNKFSLEIRMLALALQWITCLTLFPDLQNGSVEVDSDSQLSTTVIWVFLKTQIPQAPLTPAELESPKGGAQGI